MANNTKQVAPLDREFRSLLAPKLLEEAKASQVVWARVKGYPAWPAQVLSEAAAGKRKDLGQERHSKGQNVPVMFFGTIEVAWVKNIDLIGFKDGLDQGLYGRNKTKPFRLALSQVCDYLALDRKRKAPQKWWCRPPTNGMEDMLDEPAKPKPDPPRTRQRAPRAASRDNEDSEGSSATDSEEESDSDDDSSASGSAEEEGEEEEAEEEGEEEPEQDGGSDSESASSSASGSDDEEQPNRRLAAAKPPSRSASTKATVPPAPPNGKAVPGPSSRGLNRELAALKEGSSAAARDTGAVSTRAPAGRDSRLAAAASTRVSSREASALGAGPSSSGRGMVAATEAAPVAMALPSGRQPPAAASHGGTGASVHASARPHQPSSAPDMKQEAAEVAPPPRKRLRLGADGGAHGASELQPILQKVLATLPGSSHLTFDADVDVAKLPAEIRRLAGIRLPVAKRPHDKATDSPRAEHGEHDEHDGHLVPVHHDEHGAVADAACHHDHDVDMAATHSARTEPAPQADAGAAEPAPLASAAAVATQPSATPGNDRSRRSPRGKLEDGDNEETHEEQDIGGNASGSDRSDASSDHDGSEGHSDGNSHTDDDDDDDGGSSAGSSAMDDDDDEDHVRPRRRPLSRAARRRQQQQQRIRDRKAEKERRLARLLAARAADRRTSSRLAPRPAGSPRLARAPRTSAGGEPVGGRVLRSGSVSPSGPISPRTQAQPARRTLPSRLVSQAMDRVRRSQSGRAVTSPQAVVPAAAEDPAPKQVKDDPMEEEEGGAVPDAPDGVRSAAASKRGSKDGSSSGGSSPQVTAPKAPVLPLELRRLQVKAEQAILAPGADSSRVLRDRTSPVGKAPTAPPTTTSTDASAGSKRAAPVPAAAAAAIADKRRSDGSDSGAGPRSSNQGSQQRPEASDDLQASRDAQEDKPGPRPGQARPSRTGVPPRAPGTAPPRPQGIPVRRKPPVEVAGLSRPVGQLGVRQLPAIIPAKAVLSAAAAAAAAKKEVSPNMASPAAPSSTPASSATLLAGASARRPLAPKPAMATVPVSKLQRILPPVKTSSCDGRPAPACAPSPVPSVAPAPAHDNSPTSAPAPPPQRRPPASQASEDDAQLSDGDTAMAEACNEPLPPVKSDNGDDDLELGEAAAALAGLGMFTAAAPPPRALPLAAAPAPLPPQDLGPGPQPERERSRRTIIAPRMHRNTPPAPMLPLPGTACATLPAATGTTPAGPGWKWPRMEPLLPSAEQPFSLPREWLTTRVPRYEAIKRNAWMSRARPKRLPKDQVQICACRPPSGLPPVAMGDEAPRLGCRDGCLNRLSYIHCDPKVCPCGDACANRSFHQLKQPRTEAFLTTNRGWGVRSLEPIGKGAFVLEYAGEVIDEKELSRRMEHARTNGEPHFYIMELSAGLYIDARRKGNLSRLLNSSCDPNCETQKWHDATTGEVRVGIFTLRDVAAGEELVYDYYFQHYGALKQNASSFACMCGAHNCRGTMDVNPEKRRDLGRRIEVCWDADGCFYRGTVIAFHPTSGKHTVIYDDGDKEKLKLDEVPHRWLEEEVPHPVPLPAGAAGTAVASAAEPQRPQQHLPLQVAPFGRPATVGSSARSAFAVVDAGSAGEPHLPPKKRQRSLQQAAPAAPAAASSFGSQQQDSNASGGYPHQAAGQRGHTSYLGASPVNGGPAPPAAGAGTSAGLDSLLEAAEAVASLKTSMAPAGYGSRNNGSNGGAATSNGQQQQQMLHTAKVSSPRHTAVVQRAGPPQGLPPPSSSRQLLQTPQASGQSQQLGSKANGPACNGQQPHAYSRGNSVQVADSAAGQSRPANSQQHLLHHAGSSNGLNGTSSIANGSSLQVGVTREDLLWKLVGIEKPKDLLPLFACVPSERSHGNGKNGSNGSRGLASHPYGKLLSALEGSELLPQADKLRSMAAAAASMPNGAAAAATSSVKGATAAVVAQHAVAPAATSPPPAAPAAPWTAPAPHAHVAIHHAPHAQHPSMHSYYSQANGDGAMATALMHAHQHHAAPARPAQHHIPTHHAPAVRMPHAMPPHTVAAAAQAAAGMRGGAMGHGGLMQHHHAASGAVPPQWHGIHPQHVQQHYMVSELLQAYMAQHGTLPVGLVGGAAGR